MRILVLEDNPRFGGLVTEHLTNAGNAVDLVETARDFHELDKMYKYHLYLVDLNLPDADGLEVIGELRTAKRTSPILVITARSSMDALVGCLDAGADDYLIKPFNHLELLARTRALLRRRPFNRPVLYEAGNVVFDITSGDLQCQGNQISMRPSERQLFALLIRHVGQTVPRELIENTMKNVRDEWSPNTIDKLASRLRRALRVVDTGIQLKTVKGIGYVLEEVT